MEVTGSTIYDNDKSFSSQFQIQVSEMVHNLTTWKIDPTKPDDAITFSMISFTITLKRKPFQYANMYTPVAAVVLVASVSFVMPPELNTGRITLLVTLALTVAGQLNAIDVSIYITGFQQLMRIP